MTFKELCAVLKADEQKVSYWRTELKKRELINPKKGAYNRDVFSEGDVQAFQRLKTLLDDPEVETLPEALRLLENRMTPDEAMKRHRQSQRQIEQLQGKIVELRKPWYVRVARFFKRLLPWRS